MEADGGVLRRGAVGLCTVIGTSRPIREVQHELGGLTDHGGYPGLASTSWAQKHITLSLTFSKCHTKCSWRGPGCLSLQEGAMENAGPTRQQ